MHENKFSILRNYFIFLFKNRKFYTCLKMLTLYSMTCNNLCIVGIEVLMASTKIAFSAMLHHVVMMEAVSYSGTSVSIYQTTWCNIQKAAINLYISCKTMHFTCKRKIQHFIMHMNNMGNWQICPAYLLTKKRRKYMYICFIPFLWNCQMFTQLETKFLDLTGLKQDQLGHDTNKNITIIL